MSSAMRRCVPGWYIAKTKGRRWYWEKYLISVTSLSILIITARWDVEWLGPLRTKFYPDSDGKTNTATDSALKLSLQSVSKFSQHHHPWFLSMSEVVNAIVAFAVIVIIFRWATSCKSRAIDSTNMSASDKFLRQPATLPVGGQHLQLLVSGQRM